MGLKDFGKVPEDMIVRIRTRFDEIYQDDRSSFSAEDHDEVMKSDWPIQRFVIAAYKDESEALNKLVATMKWRKENSVRILPDTYFPRENYLLGAIFPFGKDKNGDKVLWLRTAGLVREPELEEIAKRFIVHRIYKIDQACGPNGYAVVIDSSGASYSMMKNMDLLHFFITTLHYHFPAAVNYVLTYQLPWYLRTMWTMAQYWVPAKRRSMVQFAHGEELHNYFDDDQLPIHYGGTCDDQWNKPPEGCPGLGDFCRFELGLSENAVKNVLHNWDTEHAYKVLQFPSDDN
ncbi:motile sperm domain-containing protein 2-like [Brevipalpus obovatus]|uniref:motile sperm domain-containing protein 2-like n=1 Tax=Brevipalpus obovatus TaxID=246614 RepID=UPI003D9DB3FF